MMRWGLIPSWSLDPKVGARTINARAETAATKPSFRDPLRNQRCLVPADAFYEWRRSAKEKQPFCFEVDDGAPFAFAGLWDWWRGPDQRLVESCTILTTTPNDLLFGVHDRMPVILPAEHYERWLDPGMQDMTRAISMLRPYDSSRMRRYPVGRQSILRPTTTRVAPRRWNCQPPPGRYSTNVSATAGLPLKRAALRAIFFRICKRKPRL